jgi:hypothetical protein
MVPVIVDQHGVIIDGHHRAKIAEDLGIPYEQKVREFASDEERYEFALGLNLKRRHLNREQMRNLIATECDRTPEASDREIARRLGCSHRTVAAVRRPPEVDKLSTLEEAEARTEHIRHELDKIDQDCIDLLTRGAPPTTVAEVLTQIWAKAAEEINDAEVTDAMWRHMVNPRIQAILGWDAA